MNVSGWVGVMRDRGPAHGDRGLVGSGGESGKRARACAPVFGSDSDGPDLGL